MPSLSLVVCAYKEVKLLERLLREATGCFDDLVVVHDGPEIEIDGEIPKKPAAIDYSALSDANNLPSGYRIPNGASNAGSMQALVHKFGGRYFEGPRSFQQEPHWPFAWSRARHDWILRLDADEFPSLELKAWLREFRARGDSPPVSAFTCIWPLWNGKRAVTLRWPKGRIFLIHRHRVRFFGMAEQVPILDGPAEDLGLRLHHEPERKSYGVQNVIFRRQAFRWRSVIAQSLVGKPTDLPRWRWSSDAWPDDWERVRKHPLRHALTTLIRYPIHELRDMSRACERPMISACLNSGLYHALLGMRVYLEMRRSKTSKP